MSSFCIMPVVSAADHSLFVSHHTGTVLILPLSPSYCKTHHLFCQKYVNDGDSCQGNIRFFARSCPSRKMLFCYSCALYREIVCLTHYNHKQIPHPCILFTLITFQLSLVVFCAGSRNMFCVLTYKPIHLSCLINTANLCCVVCPSKMLTYLGIEYFSVYASRFPERIENFVDFFPGVFNFHRRYAPKRLCPIFRFMVASNIISALVTLPKWQVVQIYSVRIYFSPIGEPCINVFLTSTAISFHNTHAHNASNVPPCQRSDRQYTAETTTNTLWRAIMLKTTAHGQWDRKPASYC